MAKLIDTRRTRTTETFVYEDGTETTVDRVAYDIEGTLHTEECPAVDALLADEDSDNGGMKLSAALEAIRATGGKECPTCAAMRAIAEYPDTTTEQKENTMPTKTATKTAAPKAPAAKAAANTAAKSGITLPPGTKSTPSVMAVIGVLDAGVIGTTKEIAAAAKVSDTAAKGALLALESAGFLTHVTASDRAKTTTWARKGVPAKKTSAAELKAIMDEKIAANDERKKAAPKATSAPKAASTSAAKAAAKAEREAVKDATGKVCLEFLTAHAGTSFSVREVEVGTGNGPETDKVKTLRPALWALVEKGLAESKPTETGRKGFMVPKPVVPKKVTGK